MDTRAMADACNDDRRFLEAGWLETPVSIELLLLTSSFGSSVTKLLPRGGQLLLSGVVAAVYACRVGERGTPRSRHGNPN